MCVLIPQGSACCASGPDHSKKGDAAWVKPGKSGGGGGRAGGKGAAGGDAGAGADEDSDDLEDRIFGADAHVIVQKGKQQHASQRGGGGAGAGGGGGRRGGRGRGRGRR